MSKKNPLSSKEKRAQLRVHLNLVSHRKSQESLKTKSLKTKSQKVKSPKSNGLEYTAGKGLEYPIFMFDWKGKRIGKIDSKEMLTEVGISHTSAAMSVRDKRMFRGIYLSYNKKIDMGQYTN